MMLKIGLVGAGYIGGVHARILAADERVKLVGFADVVEKRAQDLAHQFGGKAYTDYEQLLSSGIDAVYVTTPNTLHTPIVLSALARGIHVFCEKPMAITFEDAKRIREAARASKGLYQIGHNRRFAPVYQFAKEKIALNRSSPTRTGCSPARA
jgi:myo-inositol 2-dehydrogenase/D-chiro-inositol 1-dehydrogenase